MLEEVVKDYAVYLKLDVASGFTPVQDVIDNMLTRLEELGNVLHMVKTKNSACSLAMVADIGKYRNEVTTLSRKVSTINEVILKLQNNIDVLEKQVEKAEADFGLSNENKLKSFLKPLLKRKDSVPVSNVIGSPAKTQFESVMHNFDDKGSS